MGMGTGLCMGMVMGMGTAWVWAHHGHGYGHVHSIGMDISMGMGMRIVSVNSVVAWPVSLSSTAECLHTVCTGIQECSVIQTIHLDSIAIDSRGLCASPAVEWPVSLGIAEYMCIQCRGDQLYSVTRTIHMAGMTSYV